MEAAGPYYFDRHPRPTRRDINNTDLHVTVDKETHILEPLNKEALLSCFNCTKFRTKDLLSVEEYALATYFVVVTWKPKFTGHGVKKELRMGTAIHIG